MALHRAHQAAAKQDAIADVLAAGPGAFCVADRVEQGPAGGGDRIAGPHGRRTGDREGCRCRSVKRRIQIEHGQTLGRLLQLATQAGDGGERAGGAQARGKGWSEG